MEPARTPATPRRGAHSHTQAVQGDHASAASGRPTRVAAPALVVGAADPGAQKPPLPPLCPHWA